MKKVRFMFASIWFALMLSSCAQPAPEETRLLLDFNVAHSVNPDDRDRPSPLVISIFELKSAETFQQADLFMLYERPVNELANDLVSKRRLRELVPGIDRTDNLLLSPDTRYIGVLAEFVHLQGAKARVLVPIQPKTTTHLPLDVVGTEIKQRKITPVEQEAELQPVQM